MHRALLAATAFAALAFPAAGHATTVTVGNPLTGPGYIDSGFSGGPYTVFNTTLINGQPAGSPVDGTVVSWAVGSPDGQFGLQILRPAGAVWTATGQSLVGQLDFDPMPSPQQATNLPIAKGDLIALRTGGGTSFSQSNTGSTVRLDPALIPGQTSGPPADTDPAENYVFNATVRYCKVPNMGGTKKKKVRKVLANNDCAVGKIKNKKGKGSKRVVKQSPKPGTAISDTQGVNVTTAPVSKKKK